MHPFSSCFFCRSTTATCTEAGELLRIACPHCGPHELTVETAKFVSKELEDEAKRRIGYWIREQASLNETPALTETALSSVLALPEKTILDRANRLLQWAAKQQGTLDGTFPLKEISLRAITHSRSLDEILQLVKFLERLKYIDGRRGQNEARLSPEGFIAASEQQVVPSQSAFIAMWFDQSMLGARAAIESAVKKCGYTSIVVDNVEHINKIDDEIVAQLRRSKFVVADFTGHRGGVYFEAGFGLGLGRRVFWTCRNDDLARLHFDIRQYNCIDWKNEAELEARLQRRIEAVVGLGPRLYMSGSA